MFLLNSRAYTELSETYHQHLTIIGHSAQGALVKYRYLLKFLIYLESEGITSIEAIQTKHLTTYYATIQKEINRRTGNPKNLKTLCNMMHSIELILYYASGHRPNNTKSLQHIKVYLSQAIPRTHGINTRRNQTTLRNMPELYRTCIIKPCLRLRPSCIGNSMR